MRTVKVFVLLLLALGPGIACRDRGASSPRRGEVSTPAARKVELRKTEGRYQLFRDGQPYYVRGASGGGNLALVREAGGNSIRTYTAEGLDTLLDQAHALGLSAMVGIWVGREIEGFDYRDQAAVARQREAVRATVLRYKDHPAVLCWTLGNEPDNGANSTRHLWPALNELAVLIHALDPDHPVTIPVYPDSAPVVLRKCPDVDFVSVNAFGHLVSFSRTFRYDKPYLYTEWGVAGPWESPATFWQAVLEKPVREKYEQLDRHHASIRADSLRCLGSYVFYWGQKQEYTPTWFSFFTENGAKTPLVDLMFRLWGQGPPANRAPFLDSPAIDGGQAPPGGWRFNAGDVHAAAVAGVDPDDDPLTYHWEILSDNPTYDYPPGRGRVEVRPPAVPGLITGGEGPRIRFRAPAEAGPYRLLVCGYDGHGNGSCANAPFFVEDNRLTTTDDN